MSPNAASATSGSDAGAGSWLTDTWLLMRLYWKIDSRSTTRRSGWRLLAMLAALIGLIAIGVASAAVGYGVSFLTRPESPIRIGPGIVPGFLLTLVLMGVLVTGLNQAVRSLFLSGDLDRLVVAPVHTRSVMVAKLLSRLPSNVFILLIAAAPAFAAYGIGIKAGPIYYLGGALLLLLAPLFGLAVGAIIAMLLVRWLPPNRLNEMLAASYALLGVFIALIFQLPRLMFENEAATQATVETVGGYAARLEQLPLPTFLAGRGLVALDAGRLDGSGLVGILLYLLLTLGLFAGVVLSADRLYLSGWLKTQSSGGKRRRLEERDGVFSGRSLAVTLGLKDWLLRIRDPRQLVSLLGSGLIAVVVGALAVFRGNSGQDSLLAASASGQLQAPGAFAVLTAGFQPGVLMAAWALFVGYVMLSNTAMGALALEGASFPLLKAAPLRPREVWAAKTWSMVIPTGVLFVVVLTVARLVVDFSVTWLPYAVIAGLIYVVGLTTTNVSAGFRFANLGWVDPRRMTTGGGGLLGLLLTLAYGIPAALLTVAPFALSQLWPQWSLALAAGGLAVMGLGTWAWTKLMARWAERAWELLPA